MVLKKKTKTKKTAEFAVDLSYKFFLFITWIIVKIFRQYQIFSIEAATIPETLEVSRWNEKWNIHEINERRV